MPKFQNVQKFAETCLNTFYCQVHFYWPSCFFDFSIFFCRFGGIANCVENLEHESRPPAHSFPRGCLQTAPDSAAPLWAGLGVWRRAGELFQTQHTAWGGHRAFQFCKKKKKKKKKELFPTFKLGLLGMGDHDARKRHKK